MTQIYNDVNDLYIDEHMIMAQADLLEQMYSMLHEVNMAARNEELVYVKQNEESASTALLDPDSFPI